jgi:hypothetical protein
VKLIGNLIKLYLNKLGLELVDLAVLSAVFLEKGMPFAAFMVG